jgi:hypothetical protein
VRHAFYAPAPCAGLRLAPTPASALKLRRIGAVLRPTAEGVAAYVDATRLPALHAHAQDTAEPLEFYLLGRSNDRDFAVATAGLAGAEGQVLLLDSDAAQAPDAEGWRLLHASEFAGVDNVVPAWLPPLGDTPATATTPQVEGALPAADRRVTPAFVLRIRIEAAPTAGDNKAAPAAVVQAWAAQALNRRWRLALQARATHWKYLMPADWAAQEPRVVDLAGQIGFEAPRPESLADGYATLAARSRSAIALHQRPHQRFQLQAQRPAADKVLVKRLPVASAGQLHMETIDGVRTLVSEIFVNR